MTEILLASCGAWVWVYVLGFIKLKKKPFSCETCMSGWFCLFLMWGHTWYEVPFYMAAAMVTTCVITKTMNRL